MADKIFTNVRLGLKVDTLENWGKSTLPLKKGEVAFATVAATAGTGITEPVVMMKIGEDGVKTFKDIEWNFYAKASDVLTACKSETALKTFINGVIADAGIASNAAMEELAGKVTTAEGKITTLEGTVGNADGGLVKDVATNAAAITALEGLVGDTKVATQITEAIAGLDLANTYAAKTHTHTKSEITDFAHTHEIADVTGLQTALDGKQAVGDYATKTEAKGYADAKDEAITAAQTAANKAQGEVDALETYVGTIPTDEKYANITNVVAYVNKKAEETLASAQGGSSETAASVKAALDTYKSENDPKVAANSDAIDALETKVGEKPVAEQISTAIANEKLAETYAAKTHTHAIADVTGLSDAIADAKKAGTDASTALGEYQTANDEAVQANADAIDALEAKVGTVTEGKTVVEMIADAKTEATYDDTALAGRVTANEGAIATLNGEGAGSVKKAVDDALNDFATKVSNDGVVNTYKELVDYAAANGSDMATLTGKISTLETTVGATDAEGNQSGLVKDVAELETKVGDKTVAAQIEAAIEALKIGDYAKAADLTAAVNQHNTDKAALETEIGKKANDADLAAIAKTGSTDDLVQGELVLVFDCGNSGVTTE